FIGQFNVSSEDMKNLSISALITKMLSEADDTHKPMLQQMLGFFEKNGQGDKLLSALL
ncbi:MAG: hypothetical protein GY757_22755, partial [bacterium]|nr:hypothetical protein [bacterium]